MAPVIIAKNLYKCYPGFPPVLRGVNISVEPGEMVAIMGPSGCGKSTMLHVLGMLHAPDAGSLEVLGTDVLTLSREQTAAFRRGNMGFVMQSSNLFDHSTVFENVEFPLIYEKVPPEERWERVIRALELVRLSARVNYRSNRLSGGEQQRVAIARAMVNNPRILLADEPTGALDARTSKVVMENFRTLAHEGGVAMVVVTHDPGVAEYCDSVYTLDDGVLNCRRHDPVPPPSGDRAHLLGMTPRRMRSACVVGDFPEPLGTAAVQDVRNLHGAGVLTRVYSLQGGGMAALAGGDVHGLPVPMRRLGYAGLPRAWVAALRSLGGLWARLGRVPLGRRWLPSTLGALAAGARMAGWAREDRMEHLHALDAGQPALAAWLAAGLLDIPFSFTVRARQLPCGGLNLLAAMAADAAFVRCDTLAMLEALRAACPKVPATRFVLVRDGQTLSAPEAADYEGDLIHKGQMASGEVRLLAAGSLARRKGLSALLGACVRLKRDNVPFHLTIAGAGPAPWSLRLLRLRARFLGLRKCITFAGRLSHDKMPELLRRARIFISCPTGADVRALPLGGGAKAQVGQWPTALGEAMLYGVPVVVTDVPAQTELVTHEVNGIVVPPRSAEALAEGLLRVMRFPDDAARWAAEAQETAEASFEPQEDAHLLADMLLAARKGGE